jgi:hypothetical protein
MPRTIITGPAGVSTGTVADPVDVAAQDAALAAANLAAQLAAAANSSGP